MGAVGKAFLLGLGTLSVGLGILGIFVPLLPTTPFLLLAAACYARSSQRFYDRLLQSRYLGRHIRDYRERGRLSRAATIATLLLLWATLGLSAGLLTSSLPARGLLLLIGVGVTIHLLSARRISRWR